MHAERERDVGAAVADWKPGQNGPVEVGEYVPERFYKAIAEILAYVYELSGRAVNAREATPMPVG